MKVKDLVQLLLNVDQDSISVIFSPNKENYIPVEKILIGSLCVTPQWALEGKMILDNGFLANDNNTKIFMKMKNIDVYPAICFK